MTKDGVFASSWGQYSKRLVSKINSPCHGGVFTEEEAKEWQMHLVIGSEGSPKDGEAVRFYWLIDENKGTVADAKFQAFGPPALIGGAEAACELVIEKKYDQLRKINADFLDQELRDKADVPAFPFAAFSSLNIIIGAIDDAMCHCRDILLLKEGQTSPLPSENGDIRKGGYPGWDDLLAKEKLVLIEEVLDQEVRPYMAMDGGGVQVRDLVGKELIVSYEGNCVSCFAATGATLSYMQEVLRAKIHPKLSVTPEL